MAFNPFTSFQRNQKFWMASLTLVTMILFVFCSGMGSGGDISDRLLHYFSPRGQTVMTVANKNYTQQDLHDVRRQRDTANEFMRKAADVTVQKLTEMLKADTDKLKAAGGKQGNEKELAELQRRVGQASLLRGELLARLQQPRYFELGNKLDDILEFMTWQAQADRLNINLTHDYLSLLVRTEVFLNLLMSEEQGSMLLSQVAFEVRRGHQGMSDNLLTKALAEEFRVRLAQLATVSSQPSDYFGGGFRAQDPLLPRLVRAPMSPAMLWDFYKEKRADYDIKLIPVHVNDFLDKAPTPTPAEEESFFRRYQNDPYDPASPTPGLLVPAKVKAGFVMADPTMPIYLESARAVMQLPLAAFLFDPWQSGLGLAIREMSVDKAYEAALAQTYSGLSQTQYRGAELSSPDLVSPLGAWLARRDARSAAGYLGNLVGSLAAQVVGAPFPDASATASYVAWGVTKYPREIEIGLISEIRDRAEVYSRLLSAPASPFPVFSLLGVHASHNAAVLGVPTLPLSIVRQDVEDVRARNLAELWARENMRVVREKLERPNVAGNTVAFKLALEKYVGTYHLRYGDTKEFYNRYTIGDAQALQPLEQAFRKYVDQINFFEGRDITPERALKDSDFYKLFFGTERFTTESLYRPLPWPPAVTPKQQDVMRHGMPAGMGQAQQAAFFQMMQRQEQGQQTGTFDLFGFAEKPALYWKTADEVADKAKDLAQVRERVVRGWKIEKAREQEALPLARKIAEDLQKTGGDYSSTVLTTEAAKAGRSIINLPDVTSLYPENSGFGSRDYRNYPLPKGVFEYPRDDLVQQLLNLYDPKKPIQISTGDTDLPLKRQIDAINKSLWEQTTKEFKGKSPAGKFVQILTNKPLSEFYVAVVPLPPSASRDDFLQALQKAPWMPMIFAWQQQAQRNPQFRQFAPPSDTLIVRAHQAEGKRVRDAVLDQLKSEFKVEPPDEKLREDFDRGS
jgi:hypothetical protein